MSCSFNRRKKSSIGSVVIKTTNTEKLLGVTIDGKLSFQEHINGMCTKASQKLNALSRLSSYMSLEKRRVIMKAFVTSHFAYCPSFSLDATQQNTK